MDFLPDGRMVLTTTGDVSSGGWVPNPESGEVYVLDKVTGTTTKEQVTYTKVAGALKNPMGIQVIDGRWYVSEREGLTELPPDGDDADTLMEHKRLASWPNGGNFHEFAFGLIHDDDYFYVARSNAINNGGATTDPQPGVRSGHRDQDQPQHVAGLDDRRWPAHAERHRLRPRGRDLRQRQPGRLAAGEQDGPDQAGPLLQPLHEPARPVRRPAGHAARAVDAAERDRQLPDEPGAAQRRSVHGPDALGRRHLRRPAARLPREGRRRVPGRGLPPLGRPRGRRQPHDDRARRRDLRRRHRRGRQLGRGQQAPLRPPEAHPERQERLRHGEDGSHRGRLQDQLHAARRRRGRRPARRTRTSSSSGATSRRRSTAARRSTRSPCSSRTPRSPATRRRSRSTSTASSRAASCTSARSVPSPPTRARSCGTPRPGTRSTRCRATRRPGATGYYEAEEAQPAAAARGIATEHSGYSGSGFVGGFSTVGANLTFRSTSTRRHLPGEPALRQRPEPVHQEQDDRAVRQRRQAAELGASRPRRPTDWKAWAFSTRDLALKAGANQIKLAYETGTDGNVNFDALKIGAEQGHLRPGDRSRRATPACSTARSRASPSGAWPAAARSAARTTARIRSDGGLGLNWYTAKQFTELQPQAGLEARQGRQRWRVRRLPEPGQRPVGRGQPGLRDPDRRVRRRSTAPDRLDLHASRVPTARRSSRPSSRSASGTRTRSRSRARTSRSSSTACGQRLHHATTARDLAGLHRRPEPRRRRDRLVPQHPHQGRRDPAARGPARVAARLVQQAAGLHGRLAAGVRRGGHEGPGRRRRLRVLDGQAPGGQLHVQGRPQPQLGRELRRWWRA